MLLFCTDIAPGSPPAQSPSHHKHGVSDRGYTSVLELDLRGWIWVASFGVCSLTLAMSCNVYC